MDNKTIILIAGAVGLFLFMRSRKAKGAKLPTTTAGSWLMVDGACYDMETDAPIDCPAEALGG